MGARAGTHAALLWAGAAGSRSKGGSLSSGEDGATVEKQPHPGALPNTLLAGNPQDTRQPVRTRRGDTNTSLFPSLGGPWGCCWACSRSGAVPSSAAEVAAGPPGLAATHPLPAARVRVASAAPTLPRPPGARRAPPFPPPLRPPSPRPEPRRAPSHTVPRGPDLFPVPGPPISAGKAASSGARSHPSDRQQRAESDNSGRGHYQGQALFWDQRTAPRERACAPPLLVARRRGPGTAGAGQPSAPAHDQARPRGRSGEGTLRTARSGDPSRGRVNHARSRPAGAPSRAPRHHAAVLRTEPRGTGAPAGPAPSTAGRPRGPGRQRRRGEGTGPTPPPRLSGGLPGLGAHDPYADRCLDAATAS
ncbi:hypothetical protein H8959_012734 [Pygathrix nigripes]